MEPCNHNKQLTIASDGDEAEAVGVQYCTSCGRVLVVAWLGDHEVAMSFDGDMFYRSLVLAMARSEQGARA